MTQENIKKFFFLTLIGLGIALLIGGRGILNIKRIHNENSRIRDHIEKMKETNSSLEKEIFLLKNNKAYQEKIIREVLGFTKENEVIYEFE